MITDARAGSEAQFEGHAVIAPVGEGAVYTETGALIMGAQRFEAQRTYRWHRAGGRIEVMHADGTAFHDFDPQAGGAASAHLCGDDLYRGTYDFSQWSCWAVTWTVQGPRKDYTSVTWYVRA